MSRQNAGGLHRQGLCGFGSAPPRRDNERGAVEKEFEDVRQVLGCGEANEEVVPDVCQTLKNLRCKLCSENNTRAWLGRLCLIGKGEILQNEC